MPRVDLMCQMHLSRPPRPPSMHLFVRTRTLALGLAAASAAALLGGCAGLPFLGGAPAPAQAPPAPLVISSPVATPAPAAQEPTPAPAVQAPAPAAPPPPADKPLPPIDAATRASFDEAVRMLRANRLPEAERAFKALVDKQPMLAGAHANLGLIHRKAGRLDESAAALQEAVKLSPRQAAYHNQLGITWRALGRFDHARKAYETAIDLDSNHAAALMNLAILHDVYLGDAARAAELYTRSAALLPGEAATINKWLAELKSRKAEPKLAASAPAGSPTAPVPARKEKE
jgi:Tfp pilus assembly protein PilF